MDAQHFDAFVRSLSRGTSRRVLACGLLGGILAALPDWSSPESLAKKRKKGKNGRKKTKKKTKKSKCKPSQEKCGKACCNGSQACIAGKCLGACQFDEDDDLKTMTLQADCATKETIVIPDQFTLDGDGKTIHMTGPVSGYQSVSIAGTTVHAGVLMQNTTGTVRNVTLDRDGLACEAALAHSAIALERGNGAAIEDVEIAVTKNNPQCYRGIDAEVAANSQAVDIRRVTIAGAHDRAMFINGPTPSDGESLVRGEIRDCAIGEAIFGMLVNASRHTIAGNTVNANFGILVGTFPSNVTIDDNTITGLTGATNQTGVLFNASTKGTVSNTTVSGFACGVKSLGDADVTFGAGNNLSANSAETCAS